MAIIIEDGRGSGEALAVKNGMVLTSSRVMQALPYFSLKGNSYVVGTSSSTSYSSGPQWTVYMRNLDYKKWIVIHKIHVSIGKATQPGDYTLSIYSRAVIGTGYIVATPVPLNMSSQQTPTMDCRIGNGNVSAPGGNPIFTFPVQEMSEYLYDHPIILPFGAAMSVVINYSGTGTTKHCTNCFFFTIDPSIL